VGGGLCQEVYNVIGSIIFIQCLETNQLVTAAPPATKSNT
jgi:hypothetical protein